jgi:hypothetical protein
MLKRRVALYLLAVIALIISVFLYYKFNSDSILEKSNVGRLMSTIENSETKLGIFIEENNFSSTINEIPFDIKNYGTSVANFDVSYSVEIFKGDGWYTIPFKENIIFTEEALVLNPGENYRSKINLNSFSYRFTEGKYRIIKEFNVDKRKVTLALEFELR